MGVAPAPFLARAGHPRRKARGKSDRARQTARRKAIYLELHPETAAHVAGGKGNATADNLSAVPSFAAETAAATGKDERTVRRDAERGEKVVPERKNAAAPLGTWGKRRLEKK